MMRSERHRFRNLLAVLVVLAVFLVAMTIPRLARAEEGAPAESDSYESTKTEAIDTGALEAVAPEALEAADTEDSAPANPVDTPDASTFDLSASALEDDLWLLAQAGESSDAVTVQNLYLYDLDGTEQTLSGDYDCQKRFVIVGRSGCANTRNVVYQALDSSTKDEFADVSFLVLDVDGDRNAFQEGFGSYETDRVRFFSSGNSAYSTWAFRMYSAVGNEGSSVTLPFTVLIDKSNHVQTVLTGVQDVEELCRTYLSSNESNPDDVDPGDPHQFEPEEPDDPAAYDELSFSVWGQADMRSGRELLPLVNQARAAVGASELTWDEELEQAAFQRGAEQMVLYSHTRPNGRKCFTVWPESQLIAAGENIAMGQTSVAEVNTSWTNSSGHYENMINSDFTTFAAAHFKSESGVDFWVECFGGGNGSGITGSPVMGEAKTAIGAIKGNVWLSMCVTPGVYDSWNGGFDRSVPTLKKGQSEQLVLVAGNADIDAADVIWTSSDSSVVSVDESGNMVGVSAGSADVTGTLVSYPELFVTETVTVTDEEYDLSGEWGTCSWEIDDDGTLLVYPGTGAESDATVNWPYSYWIDYTSNIKTVRFVEQDGRKVVAPKNCSYLFGGLVNLVSVDFSGLDMSQTTSLHGLFAECPRLRQPNMVGLDTSSVVDIARMFLNCTSLQSVDLSRLNVSHVTQMYFVFQGCSALEEVNVSGWDTSRVEDMDGMFGQCSSLTSLDLSSWSTASLNWDNFTSPMFDGCSYLAELRVGDAFVVSDERGFPDATASNGLWWSTVEQQWVSKSDILAGMTGRLDIFANYEATSDELPASIRKAQVSVDGQGCAYTGQPLEPTVAVVLDGVELTAGTDYTVAYSNNVNAGTATVTVTGKGDYTGSTNATFTIARKAVTVTADNVSKVFGAGDPKLTATVTGAVGSDAIAYELSRATGETVGEYAITATGAATQGNYAVTFVNGTLAINPKGISGATVASIAAQTYAGTPIEPALSVRDGSVTLKPGTDYEVTYSNNVNAGTATVTIAGIGNYTGTKKVSFTIKPKAVTVTATNAQKVYGAADPRLSATTSGTIGSDKVTFDVSRAAGESVGSYAITPTGAAAQGNYTVTFVAGTFSITKAPFGQATVSRAVDQTYTGSPITQSFRVTYGGKTLAEGTDYKVTYKNNTNVGTATATLAGTGNYEGTQSKTFAIGPKSLDGLAVTAANKAYTGSALTTTVTVKDGSKTLVVGTDFVVNTSTYANNVNVGTASVVVEGKGNYTSTAKAEFQVTPKSISSVTVSGVAAQQWTGRAISPEPVVKDGTKTLDKGTDYTLSYANNTNPGNATITIAGRGNYAGTQAITFSITKPISDVTVSAITTQRWTGKAVTPTPTVKDGTKTLRNGTDYKLFYKDNVDPGTATVTIAGAGSYSGTKIVTFKIGAKTGTWRQSSGKWWYEYLDGDYPKSTFLDIGGGRYYFDASGWMVTGWKQVGGSWYYFRSDGRMAANDWVKSGSKWCYVGADGKMVTGWLTLGLIKYYLDNNGYMATGWKQISGKWYYFESSGAMAKGRWIQSGSKWCYLRSDGTMATGWFAESSGKTYWLDSNGYMVTGWKQISGKWYYFDASGVRVTSKWVGNYWLGSDGVMATNAWVDGNRYYVGADGAWVKGMTR